MSSDPEFITHLLDMLSPLGAVRARAMFGGHGIYLDGVMFALVADDELYFKVDERNAPRFEEAGLAPFTFTAKSGRSMTMSYRHAPAGALDDADELVDWARSGVEASLRAAAAKAGKKARKKRK